VRAIHRVVEPRRWTLYLTEDEANTLAHIAAIFQQENATLLNALPATRKVVQFVLAMQRKPVVARKPRIPTKRRHQ
jgi:hypothetical protein